MTSPIDTTDRLLALLRAVQHFDGADDTQLGHVTGLYAELAPDLSGAQQIILGESLQDVLGVRHAALAAIDTFRDTMARQHRRRRS